eukprot:sb/3476010/
MTMMECSQVFYKQVDQQVASCFVCPTRTYNYTLVLGAYNVYLPCYAVCLIGTKRLAYARPSGSRKLTPGLRPGVRADTQGICQMFIIIVSCCFERRASSLLPSFSGSFPLLPYYTAGIQLQ